MEWHLYNWDWMIIFKFKHGSEFALKVSYTCSCTRQLIFHVHTNWFPAGEMNESDLSLITSIVELLEILWTCWNSIYPQQSMFFSSHALVRDKRQEELLSWGHHNFSVHGLLKSLDVLAASKTAQKSISCRMVLPTPYTSTSSLERFLEPNFVWIVNHWNPGPNDKGYTSYYSTK